MDKRERENKLEELGNQFQKIFGVEKTPELFEGLLRDIDAKTGGKDGFHRDR